MKKIILILLLLPSITFAQQSTRRTIKLEVYPDSPSVASPCKSPKSCALESAAKLGAPMSTVTRALEELEMGVIELSKQDCLILVEPRYKVKDVITIFDLSKPSSEPRLFVIDLKKGTTTAHFASHGKNSGPGPMVSRSKLKGFNGDNGKTPLGPLLTGEEADLGRGPYGRVGNRSGLKTLRMIGTKNYNHKIKPEGGVSFEFHTKDYATASFRRKNGGMGNSGGCIVLDPEKINEVTERIQGGSLVYVAYGNEPVENFADSHLFRKKPKLTSCDLGDGEETYQGEEAAQPAL